jgi:hypothetical protein
VNLIFLALLRGFEGCTTTSTSQAKNREKFHQTPNRVFAEMPNKHA